MRVLVISDTHMRPGLARDLPEVVWAAAEGADTILHAGDVVTRDLLDALAERAPVHAVLGNNDTALVGFLPEVLELALGGVAVGMIHDSGPTAGRPARMRRRFPGADLVVYGHSHIPFAGEGVDGQILFNPGSPTERRRQPHHTYGLLDLVDGEIVDRRIVVV